MTGERTVRVGHWTAADGDTGCTVVVFPTDTVASGEVRGGAPATRDFALLDPRRMVSHLDAVVLTGGSAFGLAAVDGVAAGLADLGRGFDTRAGVVPIVVGMGLFDLADGRTRPDAAAGRAALAAVSSSVIAGRVGAGAGATVNKWQSVDLAQPSGIGHARCVVDDLEVDALIAVNAAGEIDNGSVPEQIRAGSWRPPADPAPEASFENTTIGVVWTNAVMTKLDCRLVAESGHDGFARALIPVHTAADGDALVVAATGVVDAAVSTVRLLATVAVEQAIRSVVVG